MKSEEENQVYTSHNDQHSSRRERFFSKHLKHFSPFTLTAILSGCLTGFGVLIYKVYQYSSEQGKRCISRWTPTTWTFFLEMLDQQKVLAVILIEDCLFYQDASGHQYRTGILPGSKTWLFQNIKSLPTVLSVPKGGFLKSALNGAMAPAYLDRFPLVIPSFPSQRHSTDSLRHTAQTQINVGKLLLLLFTGLAFLKEGSWLNFIWESRLDKKNAQNKDNAVTFESLVGHVDAKAELKQIIQLLKHPELMTELGIRLPRGILLEGPTGTGKTLLARAIAHEAKVPFFYMPAAGFVELYVGQGALRIRQLFNKAKRRSPSIIVIDELDALGTNRDYLGANNHEYIQALNQLLTEMDGLERDLDSRRSFIVVIAATNRFDVLDPALTRAGRFDKIISLQTPNESERQELCEMYTRRMKIDTSTVHLHTIAKLTHDFTGAEIESLFNEAALLAVRRGSPHITSLHVSEILNTLNKKRKRRVHQATPQDIASQLHQWLDKVRQGEYTKR